MDDGSLIRLATGSTPNMDLRVHDNGEGFDPDGAAGGMGLSTMRERVEEIGALLTVHSIPGDGTEIRMVWPKGHEG